ncbi:hypothetical protein BDF20DRAFT_909480 [Mycotypha africana]|uniref:uncharacterized protein n=1 Tax=Mycotypha africana TaxID=64632 RepID=UPI0023018278|nr:uncharacterized protein BDF20DRAFT_909480 [Mycotypha africana]KAI8991745.1 hypothetical protein BDF20DRAFT_909480 [Mycotypha africana]
MHTTATSIALTTTTIETTPCLDNKSVSSVTTAASEDSSSFISKNKNKTKKSGSKTETNEEGESEKPQKKRQRISPEQFKVLMAEFEKTNSPNLETRDRLGEQLGMSSRHIQVWFQNRRSKMRREMKMKAMKHREDPFVYPSMPYKPRNMDYSYSPPTPPPPPPPAPLSSSPSSSSSLSSSSQPTTQHHPYPTYSYHHYYATTQQHQQPPSQSSAALFDYPPEQQQQYPPPPHPHHSSSSQSSVTSSSSESLTSPTSTAHPHHHTTTPTRSTTATAATENNAYFNTYPYNPTSLSYPPTPELSPDMSPIDVLAVAAEYARKCDEITSAQERGGTWRPWECH